MSKIVFFENTDYQKNKTQNTANTSSIPENNADKIMQSSNNSKIVFFDGSNKQPTAPTDTGGDIVLDNLSAIPTLAKAIPNAVLDGVGSLMQLPDKAYGTYATWFEKSVLGNKDYNYELDQLSNPYSAGGISGMAKTGKALKEFDFGGATAISDEERKKHWIAAGVGDGFGQLIPLAFSGGVGAAAKLPQAAKLFSMASIYASETMGYVDRYEKDTGESIVNNPTQFAAANAYGAIASALERMGLNPYNLSGNTARQGVRKAIDELITSPLLTEKAIKESTKTVGQVVSDVVKKMIGEGVQEASQTLAEEVVARGANTISDKKIVESDSLMQDMIQSAVIGGLVGGIVDTGRNLPKSARTYHENALFDYIHNGADVGTQLMENPTVADKVKASVVEAEPETKNKRIDNVFKVIQNANVDEDSKAKALESLSYMTKISDMLDRDSSTSEPTKAFDYIKKIEAINNEINFYNNDAPSIVKEINSDKIKSLQSLKNEYVTAINQKDLNVDETAITKKYNNISKFINENITELGDEINQNIPQQETTQQELPKFVEIENSNVNIPVESLANESRALPSGNIAVKDAYNNFVFLKKIETPDRYEKITKEIAGEKFEENILVEPASIKYEVANIINKQNESYQAFSDKFSELPKYTESAVNNAKQQTTGAKSDVKEVSLSNSLSEVLTENDNPTTLESKGISVGTEIYSNRGDFKISKIEGSGQDLKIYYNKIVNGVPEGGMSQLKNPSLFYLKKSTPVPLVSTKTEVSKNNETQPKEKTNPLKRGGETKSLSEAFDGVDKNTAKEFTNFLFNRILPLLKFYYEDGKNIGRKFPVGLRIALDDNTKNRFDGNSRKNFVEVLEKLKSREVDENSDIFIGKEFDAIKYLLDKFKNKEQIKFRFGNIGNFNADQEGAFLEGTKTPYRGNLFLAIETINNAFTKLKEIVKELYGTENPLGEEGASIQVALAWATLNQKIVNIDSVEIDEDTLNTALGKTANRDKDNITKSKIASDVANKSINNEKKRDNTIINILSKYQGKKGTSTFIKNNTIRNIVGFLEYVELIARKPLDAINEGEINILSLAHEFEQYLINYNYEKTNGPNSSNDETNVGTNGDSKISTEANIQTTSDKLFKGDGDVLFSNSKIGRKLSEIRDAGIAKSIAEKKTEGRSSSVKQTTDRSILEDIANKTISDAPLTDEEYKVFKQNESEINKIILSKKGIQAVSIKEADKAIGQQQKDIAKQDTRTVKERIIQGTKIRKEDFIDQGDKNQIQGRATAQFFDKNARGIDDIADELSTDGIEITRQDIIDYILDRVANPNKYKGKQNFGEEKVTNASANNTEVVKEKPYVTFEQITNGRSLKDASLEIHGMWFREQITDENLAEVEKQIQDAIAKENSTPKDIEIGYIDRDIYFDGEKSSYHVVPTSNSYRPGYFIINEELFTKWKVLDDEEKNQKEILQKRLARAIGYEVKQNINKELKALALVFADKKRTVLADSKDTNQNFNRDKIQVDDSAIINGDKYYVQGYAFGEPMVSKNNEQKRKLSTYENSKEIKSALIKNKNEKIDKSRKDADARREAMIYGEDQFTAIRELKKILTKQQELIKAQPKIDKEQLRLDTIEEVSTRDGELDARKIQSTLSDLNRYYPNLLEILDNKKNALANETDEAKKVELQKEVDSTSLTVQKQDEKKKILLELANKTGIRRSLSVKSTNKNVRKFNKLLKALSNFKGFRGVIHSDENKLSKALEIRQLRMPDGVVYGATYLNENGVREIYINRDNISLETPIHEYFHPYLEMLYLSEDANAKAAIELFEKYAKDLGYVEKIKSNKDYADLSEEDAMKEAITTMVGEIGADKLQQPENIREKLRNLLRTALQWVSSKFGLSISQYKVEDISKLSASDLVLASLASAKKGEFYQDITGDELNLSTNPKFRMDKGTDIKEESNVLSPFSFSEISNNILRKFTQTQISDAFKVFANQDNKITKGLLKGLSPSVIFSNKNYEDLITLLQNGDPSFSYAKRIIPSLTQEEFDLRYGVLDYFEDEKNYHKAFSKNFIVSNGRVLDITNDYESIKKQLDIVNLFIIPKRLLDGRTILELLGKKGQAFYDFFTAGFTELREKSSKFSILLTEKEQAISDLGKGLIITGTTEDNATEYDSLRKLSIERLVDDKSEKLDISVGEAISLLLTHDYQIQNNGESYLSVGPVDSTESVDNQSGVFIENPNFKGVITMSDEAIEELRDKLKPYQNLIDKVKDFYHGQEAMEMYKQINESLINTTGRKSEIYDGFIPINKRTAKTASEKLAAKSVNAFESLSFNFNQKANGQIQVKDIGVDLNLMASYANIGLKSIPMQETYRKYYDIIKDKKDFPESIKGWFEDRLKYGYIESPNTSNLEQFLQSARAASIFSLRVLGTATQYTGLAKGYASTVIKSKYLKVELRMYADMFLGTKALNRIKDGILREKSSNIVEWTSADWEKYTSKEVAQIISEIKANNSVLYDRFLNQMIYMQDAVRKNKGYVPEVSLSTSKDDLSDIANKKFGEQATKLKEKWIDKNLRYLLSGIYWGDAMAVIAMTKAAKRQAAAEGHDLKFAMELALAAVEETQVMDDDFYKSNYTIISRGDSSESFALRQLMAFQQESQQLSNMVLTSYIRKQKNINSYNGDSASTALNKTIGYGVVVGAVSFGLVQLLRGALLKSPCTKTNIYKNAVAGVTQNMLALQPFSPIVNAAVQYPENKLLKMAGVDIYNPNDYGNILGVLKEPLQISKELPEGKYKSVVKTMITMFGVPGDIAKFIVDCISK